MHLLFHTTFFLFLIPHILADHFFVDTNGIHTIASRPEMIAPIGFYFQVRVIPEKTNGRTSFQDSHQLRNRYFRRNHHHQMNMIFLDVQFQYLTAFLSAKYMDTFPEFRFKYSIQNSIPIFRNPDNMILAMPDHVCYFTKSAHGYILSRDCGNSSRIVYRGQTFRQTLKASDPAQRTGVSRTN